MRIIRPRTLLAQGAPTLVGSGNVGGIPAWVTNLQPGTSSAVSLNLPKNLDPDPNRVQTWDKPGGSGGMRMMWQGVGAGGGRFNPYWGRLGALFNWGGGHLSYQGNQILNWEVDTLVWLALTDPFKSFDGTLGVPLQNSDPTWADFLPIETPATNGSPVSAHCYDIQVMMPPGSFGGIVGAKGAFFMPAQTALGYQSPWWAPAGHLYDFAAGAPWQRFPLNSFMPITHNNIGTNMSGLFDTVGNRVLTMGPSDTYIAQLPNTNNPSWSKINLAVSSALLSGGITTAFYAAKNWILAFQNTGLFVCDLNQSPPKWVAQPLTQPYTSWPTSAGQAGFSVGFVPELGDFFLYVFSVDGLTQLSTIYWITPGANISATPWNVITETFTGTINGNFKSPDWGRFFFHPTLKVFLYSGAYDQPVYAIKSTRIHL